MTLADNVLLSSRSLTYVVQIYTTLSTTGATTPSGAAVALTAAANPTSATGNPGVTSVRVSKSMDSPVPVCQLELTRVPTWITRGMGVTVDVGYNGLTQRIFTGFIQSRERKTSAGTVTCMGRLWSAFRTVQIAQRSVDGVTVSSAIGTILDYVGITDNRSLTVPAFTLGTASAPVLERMPASQMLQMLMDIDGCRIYETGTGLVVIAVLDEQPAPTSFKTYTTSTNASARVLEATDREDPEYYRNRVIVTGATVTEGSAPDQTSRTITATATNVGSQLVQPALPSGTFIDAEYNNHLIDTDAKAASVAIRLLNKFARIPRQLSIEIAGDPELEIGQTLTFTIPELDLNDRGFISGIEHVIDSEGYRTTLTDFRGSGDTGGTLAQNPIAAFTFKSEREVWGAAINVIATLDASSSFDPDGTIVSYAWSDNQTTTPEIATFTTRFPIVRADTSAWTGSWDVTLTVTDNAGLTGSTTISIPYKNTDAQIVIPAIYAAINNRHSASLDGGATFSDQTVGSGLSIAVGARPSDGTTVGQACYGTTTGRIYRTTDGLATAPTLVYTTAAAVAINDVQWDWRNPNVVWAIDENCILYVSIDAGVTWGIYGGAGLRTTLGLAGALGNKIGLPAGGGVYIFGGNGAGTPLIAYDAALTNNWVHQIFTGDIATDMTGSDATMRIVDFTAGFTKGVMILSWTSSVGYGAGLTAIYSTASAPAPSVAYTRATGLTAGIKTGRYMVSDNVLIESDSYYAAFADRSIWHSTDGIAWTETTNVMPAAVTPWHAIGMTGSTELTGIVGMFGVFMIAASDGIYKWTSGEATASPIREAGPLGAATPNWPASAIGKKLAMGAPGASTPAGLAPKVIFETTGSPAQVLYTAGTQTFQTVSVGANMTDGARPYAITTLNWIATDRDPFTAQTGTDPETCVAARYTVDGGGTWGSSAIGDETAVGFIGGIGLVATDAGGRIWGARGKGQLTSTPITTDIYYSDTSGASWVFSKNVAVAANSRRQPYELACHPTNQNIIALLTCNREIGDDRLLTVVTLDRGATWTVYGNGTTVASGNNEASTSTGGAGKSLVILPNGRFLLFWVSATYSHVWSSDNYGDSWTQRLSDTTHGAYSYAGMDVAGGKIVALRAPIVAFGSASDTAIYTSTDSGTTWAAISTTVPAVLQVVDNDWNVGYHAATDTLYIYQNHGAQYLYSFSPVSSSGVWRDLSTASLPSIIWRGMAVVP